MQDLAAGFMAKRRGRQLIDSLEREIAQLRQIDIDCDRLSPAQDELLGRAASSGTHIENARGLGKVDFGKTSREHVIHQGGDGFGLLGEQFLAP